MNEQAKAIQSKMEAKMSKISGFQVELTIRTISSWTISAIGNHTFDKVKGFFIDRLIEWEVEYDQELDETFAYMTVK